MTCPTAATSEVAPGEQAGQELGGRRGAAAAAMAAADGGAGVSIVVTGAACRFRVTLACRRAGRHRRAAPRPGRPAGRRRAASRTPPTGPGRVSTASQRPGGHDPARREHERVVEARRDLLEVVGDEHDRPPAVARRQARSDRASSVSRAARSRLAAGSSSRSRSGSGIRARAIETRRRSPADSVPNGWSARVGHARPAPSAPGPGPVGVGRTRATTARSRACRAVMTRSTGGGPARRTASTALPARAHPRAQLADVDLAVARAEDLDGAGGRPERQPERPRAASSCPSRWGRGRPSARRRRPASRSGRGWSGRRVGRRRPRDVDRSRPRS